MRLVIVGGVAGGVAVAARARRLSEDAEICLIERGPNVSLVDCGLPYYIGETILDRGKLLPTSALQLTERHNLNVRTLSRLEGIDRERKTVRIHNLEGDLTYDLPYDRLILAVGAAPARPPLPGVSLPGIETLHSLEDADRIKARLDSGRRSVVIVGAGILGLELAENLSQRGVKTMLVERQPQILPALDQEMTTPLLAVLLTLGVGVRLGQAVQKFEQAPVGLHTILSQGEVLQSDLVLLGTGTWPENQLAFQAGLAIGPQGGLQVNQFQQTNDPNIYAIGAACEVDDFVLRRQSRVSLPGPARRQARVAADHIFDRRSQYRGTQGTAIVSVYDRVAAITGASEKTLQKLQIPCRSCYVHAEHHASFFPGARQMTLKLLFSPETGRILGAQAVGWEGTDKRIDLLSVAIQTGMTVEHLEEMELACAPQFGSVKDPVNLLGCIASGMRNGDHPQLPVTSLLNSPADDWPFLLDVRSAREYAAGHLPGAVNIPLRQLRARLDELPVREPIVTYCRTGQRGYFATRILLQSRFEAMNLGGGYLTYRLFRPEFR